MDYEKLKHEYGDSENIIAVGSVRRGMDLVFVKTAIEKAVKNTQTSALIVQNTSAKFFEEYSSYLASIGYLVYEYNPYNEKSSLINFDIRFYGQQPVAIFLTTPPVLSGVPCEASKGFLLNLLLELNRQFKQQSVENKGIINIILSDFDGLGKTDYLSKLVSPKRNKKIYLKIFTKDIEHFDYLYGERVDTFRVIKLLE